MIDKNFNFVTNNTDVIKEIARFQEELNKKYKQNYTQDEAILTAIIYATNKLLISYED